MTNIGETEPVVISDNHTIFLPKRTCGCREEVAIIKDPEKIEELLQAKSSIITAKQVTDAGLHRSALRELVEKKEIYPYSRGIYIRNDAWEDTFYLLQQKYARGIFSHETALYLHGYSDRLPEWYTMTFPKGYHSHSLKEELVFVRHTIPENYGLGVVEIPSLCGNPIRVYDLERSLCDCLRGSYIDVQVVGDAMRRYANSENKNIHKLTCYAKQLHVLSKVMSYMEALLRFRRSGIADSLDFRQLHINLYENDVWLSNR